MNKIKRTDRFLVTSSPPYAQLIVKQANGNPPPLILCFVFICIIKCSHSRLSVHFKVNSVEGNEMVQNGGWDPPVSVGFNWAQSTWHSVPTDFTESIFSGNILWLLFARTTQPVSMATQANSTQKTMGATASHCPEWQKWSLNLLQSLQDLCLARVWGMENSGVCAGISIPVSGTVCLELKTHRCQSDLPWAQQDHSPARNTTHLPLILLLRIKVELFLVSPSLPRESPSPQICSTQGTAPCMVWNGLSHPAVFYVKQITRQLKNKKPKPPLPGPV